MMISTRKLISMARKWQRKVAMRRKRVTFSRKEVSESSITAAACSTTSSSPVAEKGHFVVYTLDQKRYSFPIAYLNNYIFRELLIMAEEEFGLASDGQITIPCEADVMDYLVSLIIHRRATEEVEKALLLSIKGYRCSSNICMVDQWKIDHHNHSSVPCFLV